MEQNAEKLRILERKITLEESRTARRIAVLQAERDIVSSICSDPQPPMRGNYVYWDILASYGVKKIGV